jgi:hypothetical protein
MSLLFENTRVARELRESIIRSRFYLKRFERYVFRFNVTGTYILFSLRCLIYNILFQMSAQVQWI